MKTSQFLVIVALLLVIVSQGPMVDGKHPFVGAAGALLFTSGIFWGIERDRRRREGRPPHGQ